MDSPPRLMPSSAPSPTASTHSPLCRSPWCWPREDLPGLISSHSTSHFGGWIEKLTSRDNNPKQVHKHIVPIKVIGLRSRVRLVKHVMVKHARGIVEHVAVELAQRHNDLQRMAQGVLGRNHVCHDKRQGAPADLSQRLAIQYKPYSWNRQDSYRSDGLHTEHKWVLGQVARVGERVFLPELAEDGLQAAHGAEVVDIVLRRVSY